jgi:cysteinyl-tRNA synthetase
MNSGELDGDQVRQVLDFMRQANRILDVMDFQDEDDDAQVKRLVEDRDRARQERDFRRADTFREELRSMGVRLADSRSGTRWKKN